MAITSKVQPSKLTYWAAKNIMLAVCLIVLIEFVKFGIGFYIGKNVFPAFSANSLTIAAILIAVSVFVSQNYFNEKVRTTDSKYAFDIIVKGNLVLFLASFILSTLVGNQWNRIENPTANADIFATLIEEKQHEINGDSLLFAVQQEQQLKKQPQLTNDRPNNPTEGKNDGLQRLGYFGLFALAMILTYFGLFLACGLACGSFGFVAALVLLLDLGIFSGGIYFLLKVFRNGKIKRWREMDKAERKKEGKRYFRTMLISIGTLGAFLIIANLLG